jgi:hypothetical protein
MLHQAVRLDSENLERWRRGLEFWQSRASDDHPQSLVALEQWKAFEMPYVRAVAYDVTRLSATQWEVIRILDDETTWMQIVDLDDATEKQALQYAIVSSHKFKQIG